MIFNQDFREFIESLNKHKVRYLLIGGYTNGPINELKISVFLLPCHSIEGVWGRKINHIIYLKIATGRPVWLTWKI